MTLTLSKVAAAFTPLTWLDTPRPTSTDAGIENVLLAIGVQGVPFTDSNAVMVFPARVSFTHRGATDRLPVVLVLAPPSVRRR